MLRRNFSSAIMAEILTLYHSVIFLEVVGARKRLTMLNAPCLLAARFHLLARVICNFTAGLIAATINHLLAARASHAATLVYVAHAITASLDFNVAVLFYFFLCNLGFFYFDFNRFFLLLEFSRLNLDFPGYFCDFFCYHLWN